jgi:pyrimidine operon attenuation protein/uracil phosphoribosyltransferase
MSTATGRVLLDAEQLGRTLARIGYEIVEKQPNLEQLCLVGIYTRGVPLAHRLRRRIAETTGVDVPVGALDIAFYRDDVAVRGAESPAHAQPVLNDTKLDFPIEGRTVVLVDDVLFTGRTIRAGIDAIFDYGRPARVQLAVLADRGHRELPIRADYVGKNLPTARTERVTVRLLETDEVDEVVLVPAASGEGKE